MAGKKIRKDGHQHIDARKPVSAGHKSMIMKTAIQNAHAGRVCDNEKKKVETRGRAQEDQKPEHFPSLLIVFNGVNAGRAEDGPKTVGKGEINESEPPQKRFLFPVPEGKSEKTFDQLLKGEKSGEGGEEKFFFCPDILKGRCTDGREDGTCGETGNRPKTHRLTLTAWLPLSKDIKPLP